MGWAVDNGLTADLYGKVRRLGTGINFRGALPVYDGRHTGLNTPHMDVMPVLWLFPCEAQAVRLAGLPMWEGLDAALVGMGRWAGTALAVYDYSMALQAIDASIVDVPADSAADLVGVAVKRILDEQVMPTDIGPATPFFIL